jgi:hypothetical protein
MFTKIDKHDSPERAAIIVGIIKEREKLQYPAGSTPTWDPGTGGDFKKKKRRIFIVSLGQQKTHLMSDIPYYVRHDPNLDRWYV